MNLTKHLTKMTLRMINQFRFLPVFLGCFFLSTIGIAQSWEIVTKVEVGRVVVRWVPLDAASWVEGHKKGFRLTVRYQGQTSASKTLFFTPQNSTFFLAQRDSVPNANLMAELINQLPSNEGSDLDISFGLAMALSATHPTLADGLGMRWVDTPPKGVTRVTYQLSEPQGTVLAEKTVDLNKVTTLFRPLDLQAEQSDSLLTFRWIPGDSLLNWAYRLEISEDGDHWRPVDDLLILPAVDEQGNEYLAKEFRIPKFYVPYYFRVLAYTPFGELSIPSRRIQVTAYRQRFPMLEPSFQPKPSGVLYQWDFPDSLSAEIKGFKVYTSRKIEDEGREIAFLPSQARAWLDTAALLDSYTYLTLVDWGGGEHRSSRMFVTWPDSIPPAPVVGLRSQVSAEGVVQLSWPKVTAPDFLGYRVFRSDSPTANYVLITPTIIQDTTWTDTLSVALLNTQVYYTLRALDTRLNGSVGNDTLLVIRPDHIPPAALSIRSVQQREEGVYLQWFLSSSTDVVWVQLLRQAPSDSVPCLLALFDAEFPTEWMDSTGEEGKLYTYSLVAMDAGGLLSEPASVRLQKIFTGVRPALGRTEIKAWPEERKIEISWEIPTRPVRRYQIYRQGPNDQYLVPYRKQEGRYGIFEDQNLEIGVRYRYQIQALFDDGSESKLGEVLTVYWQE